MIEYTHNPNLLPITDVIPHRPPHLYLSGIRELVPGTSVSGFWLPEAGQFEGHFPDDPILQGVQQLEALAQLGCYSAMYEDPAEKRVLFAGSEVKWSSPVFPEETLELQVRLAEQRKRMLFEGLGTASVSGVVTCEATIRGLIVPTAVYNKRIKAAKVQRAVKPEVS